MVVLLVALTFGICLLIDRLTHPKPAPPTSVWIQPDHVFQNTLETEQTVEGYRYYEGVHFHQGHMWVKTEGSFRARIGLDDFVCKHAFPTTALEPLSKHTFRQGAPCLRIYTQTHHIDLLSPIGGKIIATNKVSFQSPSQIAKNPFVTWLFLVENKNMPTEQNNLIRGEWVFIWMKQEASQLRLRQKMGLQIDDVFLSTFFSGQAPPCSGH